MQVYLGIDWSQKKHDAVFLNPGGALIAQITFDHSPEGFLYLEATRTRLGVAAGECRVGLETAHNLLVDFLWSRGYDQLFVLPPRLVKSSRLRYRQSGAHSDVSDAFVIADVLRTDQGRLQPWIRDSLLVRQLRAQVSLILHLTRTITRHSNRLTALLARYYPAALQVFSDLTSSTSLAFLQRYPTPEASQALCFSDFESFARQQRYPHPRRLPRCFARLQAPQPTGDAETTLVYAQETALLAGLLADLVRAKRTALQQLATLFQQHPDGEIFLSLPGAGPLLAPALLAKFGDDRRRFPDGASVQTLAGTCPVTEQSGKRRWVHFRYACDREFRHIAQQWARCSLQESVWANSYWQRVRPHCASDNHALRCLANRWLGVLWRLWQARSVYDEAIHLAHCLERSQPRS
ncbi:MAG TPA: IS110 family transposase [Anaerolineales bacterium]|nr:IS110 family transposase [Anaerolineales bacterium]HLE82133.1 IS110 family transposase [Dehalococcoidia bacterium]